MNSTYILNSTRDRKLGKLKGSDQWEDWGVKSTVSEPKRFFPDPATVKAGNSVTGYQVCQVQRKILAEPTPRICNDINILYKIWS